LETTRKMFEEALREIGPVKADDVEFELWKRYTDQFALKKDIDPRITRGIDVSSQISMKGDNLFKFDTEKPTYADEKSPYLLGSKFKHGNIAVDSEGKIIDRYLFTRGPIVIFRGDPHSPAIPGHGDPEVEYTVKNRFKYGRDSPRNQDLKQKYKYKKRVPWDDPE